MRGRLAVAVALALPLGVAACSRRPNAPGAAAPLQGNAVWFAEGIGAGDPAIEETLARFRCAAVFLPARRLAVGGAGAPGSDLPSPPSPLSRIPVVLVVSASEDPLVGADEKRGKQFGRDLAREIGAAVARQAEFGPVRGVHLDVPFGGATAPAHAVALREARSQLSHLLAASEKATRAPARELPLTISMRGPAPVDEKELNAVRALASRTDGIVAFLSAEEGEAADPAFVDSLGKPWLVAYGSATRGALRRSSGEAGAPIPEAALDPLTDDPRTELLHELPWNEGRGSGFTLRATRSLSVSGATLGAGDSAVFSQPSLSDVLAGLRPAVSRRRFARGHVVVFGAGPDAGRVFPVAALADVLIGHSPAPELRAWADAEGSRLVRFGAGNPSPHASVVSREQNWIEVDLSPARVADVALGGFERWEAYDEHGLPVSPGRASRVRLYETFVAPFEQIEPARLRVRGQTPAGCCRIRTHVAPAAGGEVTTDWRMPENGPGNGKRKAEEEGAESR